MPCFCWISDESVEKELLEIRNHMKEVVRLIRVIDHHGDLSQKGSPLPRDLVKDCHKLLDDLYRGECSETGNKL